MIFNMGGGSAKPEGEFVWKKCKEAIISFTQLNSGSAPLLIQCSSDDVDLSTVDESFFYGMMGSLTNGSTTYTYEFAEGSQFFTNGSDVVNDYTYDPNTMRISIIGRQFGAIYTWTDCEKDVSVKFLVSDSENKYPDGEEVNGRRR